MSSRSKKQVKRKTLLKVYYLKKLKNILLEKKYWGFCNFANSDNKVKKSFLSEINYNTALKGFIFLKVRLSFMQKVMRLVGASDETISLINPLLKSSVLLLATDNITNVINFPVKEYEQTKLSVIAWKLKTQVYSQIVFLNNKILLQRMQKSSISLIKSLNCAKKVLRILNWKFVKENANN